MTVPEKVRIAYFSMEIAANADFPTYAGGLGVLAGDTLRSAADLGVPIAAVTLLHRKGYFQQRLDAEGRQSEGAQEWEPERVLEPVDPVVAVELAGRTVKARAWRHSIAGVTGNRVPVYFLDTHLPENSSWERTLTDCLYGGDPTYRLCQEAVLGIGGIRLLRALGYLEIERFHMNEGHSALLAVELLHERLGSGKLDEADLEAVHSLCVFTTHTPVPAAFDQFPLDLAARILGPTVARCTAVKLCALH
jgi:glycogen phosphorylase